ncbi:protein involved in gliding motility SprE [Zunongwangia mangrovi]|uniref:Protein involved in gliding motility SprE n=1 Tax=Zunongwangia mangrovi TaxID=1334022 RepID=A0A1I1DQ01_9FLAO|nr:protein involved in gliding motility SprE [Zunongwangia mangrovi]
MVLRRFLHVVFVFFLIGAILSCSRKKDTFISRSWHSVTAEYNTLYNGNLALEAGREELNQNYKDNYWDLLPIERMQIDEEILLPDSVRNQNFGVAEQKAVKAIQRHSMLIDGDEENPQIDEAYMLLGKARYFDQRFIPALEAFNYILQRYPASNSIRNAQIWREKTNIRLENNRIAIRNLKRIIENAQFEDQEYADAKAAMAQAYINLQYPDSALAPLTTAANFTNKNEEKGRYFFILGQLYNLLNQPENANLAFDEVIELNRKSPRIYMINAYIQKARNFDPEENNDQQLKELLISLEEDRENRPFLDKIYFQFGEYYNQRDSLDTAIVFYNKSLRSRANSDPYLRSINYEILANINFDRSNYQRAAKYFDSTLFEMNSSLREYRTIEKKRKNLDDVIFYQSIADKNDSILDLTKLSREEQIAFYTEYTNKLKEDYQNQIEEGETEEALALNTAGPGVPNTGIPNIGVPGEENTNKFYFYNDNLISRGEREFLRVWGNRQLADNWRWMATGNTTAMATSEDGADFDFTSDPRFNPVTYVDKLPTDNKVIDSLYKERNYAYYQLGLIYNEKFAEYRLSANRLEEVLASDPEDRLVLPSKYNLYKAYGNLNMLAKQDEMKRDIITNYPDSQYAIFIQNPQSLANGESLPKMSYENTFELFENKEFTEVISESNKFITRYSGEEIVPKFELLKAMAIGRLKGLSEYRTALSHVSLTYPQSPEGQKAKQMISESLPRLSRLQLQQDSLAKNYKLVYEFDANKKEEALEFQQKLDSAMVDLDYSNLSTSLDPYTIDRLFVVVHGLEDRARALGFGELLRENDDYKLENDFIAISTNNYRVILLRKNLDTYKTDY